MVSGKFWPKTKTKDWKNFQSLDDEGANVKTDVTDKRKEKGDNMTDKTDNKEAYKFWKGRQQNISDKHRN